VIDWLDPPVQRAHEQDTRRSETDC